MLRWIDRQSKRNVVVHMSDGVSVRGVLFGVYKDCLVLHHAAYLSSGEETRVDGEVILPRTNLSWIQVMNSTEERK
jgi:hypothetical protein